MRKYYLICSKDEKVQKDSAQISWSHNMFIFDRIKDNEKRLWYINETAINVWVMNYLFYNKYLFLLF